MGDFTATVNAIRTRLEQFTALPLRWPNDDQPAPTLEVAPNGFVYSEIRLTDESPASLGPNGQRMHRDYGECAVYVYVPHGTRVGAAEAYAEQIRALFKATDVEGVVFTRRFIGAGERSDSTAGRYWAVPVILQFYANRME